MSAGSSGAKTGLSKDTTLDDLDVAWVERMAEAKSLATAGFHMMSLSLRIYALEIRTKSIICKKLNLKSLPSHCITHDLDELLIFTGLQTELYDPANDAVRKNWDLLKSFSKSRLNNLRYLPSSSLSKSDLTKAIEALDDPTNGVWLWLSKHP